MHVAEHEVEALGKEQLPSGPLASVNVPQQYGAPGPHAAGPAHSNALCPPAHWVPVHETASVSPVVVAQHTSPASHGELGQSTSGGGAEASPAQPSEASFPQTGAAHVPLWQLPSQQSLAPWHASPG
jgi:hypothetical protein